MNLRQLEKIEVRVEPWPGDRSRRAAYFTDARFASLYPAQRYHYLRMAQGGYCDCETLYNVVEASR
jgi:hypothetical protein